MKPTETTADGELTAASARALASCPHLLIAFQGGRAGAGEAHALPDGGVLIGRDAPLFDGALDDPQLSRQHAEIRRREGRFTVADLGSRNGTFVNGTKLDAPRPLAPGDVVRAGATFLVYASRAPAASAPPIAPGLVGHSDAVAAVRRAIGIAAGKAQNVLVMGETGTGKELVAGALHHHSGRGGRLVTINCGAFAEGVLASELFGHVRGAFTGATGDQPGLFRSAQRGTLFLDEVGEIPLALQAQLLRALEARVVRPVGSGEDVAVDVMVVSATNRDLAAEVRAGRFRADLYARVAQWFVTIPPLRERRDDIPALSEHLLARSNAAGRALSPAFAEALLLHEWPLNVRGLASVLSIAVLSSPSDGPLDCVPEVRAALDMQNVTADPPAESADAGPDLATLEQALSRARGRVAVAARELGYSRQQLYRLMKKRGLDPARFR